MASRRNDGPLAGTASAMGEGVSAVSYTHLRAHETVLDLVCRLLLEKKKGPPKETAGLSTITATGN